MSDSAFSITRKQFVAGVLGVIASPAFANTKTGSNIVNFKLSSDCFLQNKIGVGNDRSINVYLPIGYEKNTKRYPVIYYLPNIFDDAAALFSNHGGRALLDEAIASGLIRDVIVVSGDYNTPVGSSFYTNSSVTGRWHDFIVQDLVSHIDRTFPTIASANSRGLLGDRMGGYGAIRIGMRHPEVFGNIYALNPVGTGNGVQKMQQRPDWKALWDAKSLDDLKANIFNQIFVSIYHAHLPNPEKAPLFVDLPVSLEGGELRYDEALIAKLQQSFFLEHMIPQFAPNLRKLKSLKFDWGRNDPIFDHIFSNQAFAFKLSEYALPFEAEEHGGGFGDRHWGRNGRFMTDALPFFERNLEF